MTIVYDSVNVHRVIVVRYTSTMANATTMTIGSSRRVLIDRQHIGSDVSGLRALAREIALAREARESWYEPPGRLFPHDECANANRMSFGIQLAYTGPLARSRIRRWKSLKEKRQGWGLRA